MTEFLLQAWQETGPQVQAARPLPIGEGVLDEGGFNALEVEKLFAAVNHASTTIGQAVLYRSLVQPSASLETLQAKQDAVRELEGDPQLWADFTTLVQHAAAQEPEFYRLLFGQFVGSFTTSLSSGEIEGYGYAQYRKGVQFWLDLVAQAQAIPTPKSAYLQNCLATLCGFAQTRAYSLMKGPVFITENGLQSREERRGSWLPAIIFVPRIFKPLLFALVFAAYWLGKLFLPPEFRPDVPGEAIYLLPFGLVYFPLVGAFDRDKAIIPLRNIYKTSPEVAQALEALGQLDELLSFRQFAETFGHATVLPTLVTAEHHQLNLAEARNPVLAKANPDYVGNSLTLTEEKLLFVTGPNSGGKTAFCKTLTQIQLLAQIGCYVPAAAARLTVADKIFYQVPEISQLQDGEGRFGTELKRTRDIFLAATEQSLVVLDELSEGTTFEEKMEASKNVLNGFYQKGNTTVLITHNHQLVDQFTQEGIGLARQVEFADEAPTYRLVPGISRVSHADRIAKKIGFSKADIDHYLANKP